jgi:hypothetical protein
VEQFIKIEDTNSYLRIFLGMWMLFGLFSLDLHRLLIRCTQGYFVLALAKLGLRIGPPFVNLWLLGLHVHCVLDWIDRSCRLCSLLSVEQFMNIKDTN